jgi:ATP-dependent RNA helicase DDX18/HAS1
MPSSSSAHKLFQAMAYGPILEGRSCVVADQSGSGKTLAYLCPIIQNLRNEEVQGLHKSSPRNPRVIVLTPTAELASQVCHLFNNASHVFYA